MVGAGRFKGCAGLWDSGQSSSLLGGALRIVPRPARIRSMGHPSTMDKLTPAERSERMSRIRGRNTKPELIVRKLVHSMGFRYRLHKRELPGCPDLVFSARRKVIFVHGCFWHLHENCRQYRYPQSRLDFWDSKLQENRRRDDAAQVALKQMGWQCLVIWECQLRNKEALRETIREFMEREHESA